MRRPWIRKFRQAATLDSKIARAHRLIQVQLPLAIPQLKTGPSGDGATSGVGETVNFSLASGQKLVDELCSAQDQARTSKPGESAKD